jgi:predicted rRNA methylase YqxC with S4 and FtsJ domains
VRADAAIRIQNRRCRRGTIKLARALTTFWIHAAGAVALDLGAAGGGFTQALLDAGAAGVYAVDAGTGQFRGRLRADPRVISLERTNLARLDPHIIGEPVNLITMGLSYLAVADAIGQIDRQLLAPAAQLIALIKPTFELHAAALAGRPEQVTSAVDAAERALRHHGWRVLGQRPSPILGAKERPECSCTPHTGCQRRRQLLPSAQGVSVYLRGQKRPPVQPRGYALQRFCDLVRSEPVSVRRFLRR